MNKNSERGSAIFMIFIAIALFGLLAYAFMHGSRSNVSWLTTEKTNSYAAELIAYGNDMQMSVKRLQGRGCTDTQISFENFFFDSYGWTDYNNPNSPTDESCHVFSVKGGGMKYMADTKMMTQAAIDKGWTAVYFSSYDAVPGLGTDCATADCNELIMSNWGVPKEICIAINNKLGITNPSGNPPNDQFWASNLFAGTYTYYAPSVATVETSLTGKRAACMKAAFCDGFITGGCYVFYRVLIER